MASKGKKEAVNVKEKKPPSPSNITISRRRSLGPTSIPIPIPSSPDRIHRQIQQSPKQPKAINVDQITPKGTPKGSPSRKFLTPPSTPDKTALQRRRSLDKPPSPSQLPKPLTAQSPRDRKLPSPSTSKAKTATALQRPATKEKSPRQISTLPKQSVVERPTTNLTSPRLGSGRSVKQLNKDVEKPQILKNVSKMVKKPVSTSHVKQKSSASTSGSIRKPRNSPIAIAATSEDESLVKVDDSKVQDSCDVEFQKEMVHDELPVDVLILEDNGVSDLVLDEHFLNQEQDEQISATPTFEMEESQELISKASSFTEGEFMHYQQETIPQEDECENGDQTVIDEPVKVDQTIEERSIDDAEESKELEEAKPEENLIVVSTRPKKDSPAYNDVIEETASRLREQRKNKVRALVGAFETVISLEDPMADSYLPR